MTKSSFDSEAIKKDILSGVGYGRPPQHSRFQKGKSGNPQGRPRKTPSNLTPVLNSDMGTHAETMRQILAEPVKVRVNGRIRAISKAEAIQRNHEKLALGGSILATRDIKNELRAEDARRAAELESDHLFWKSYIQHYRAELLRSNETGNPVRGFWIEPENIIIKCGMPVRLRGPCREEEVKDFEFLQRLLWAYLVKQVYDVVVFSKQTIGRPEVAIHFSAFWARANWLMTAQMERDNEMYWNSLEEICQQPITTLVTEIKARWADIGMPAPLREPLPLPSFPPRLLKKLKGTFRNDPAAMEFIKPLNPVQGSRLERARYRKIQIAV